MTPQEYKTEAARWRREALSSKIPEQFRWYAENMELLAADMERDPLSYANKPLGRTDWEHFQQRHKGAA